MVLHTPELPLEECRGCTAAVSGELQMGPEPVYNRYITSFNLATNIYGGDALTLPSHPPPFDTRALEPHPDSVTRWVGICMPSLKPAEPERGRDLGNPLFLLAPSPHTPRVRQYLDLDPVRVQQYLDLCPGVPGTSSTWTWT